jgi:hypothetical protein
MLSATKNEFTKKQHDVLISCSSINRKFAEKIALTLDKAGLNVWFDRWELRPGQQWMVALEEALESSRSIVLIIGPDGLGTWAQNEMVYGLSERRKDSTFEVIPVLGPGSAPGKIPAMLRTLSYLDLREWRPQIVEELVEVIERLSKPTDRKRSAPRIFLCHANEDKKRVEELYFMLKDEGFDAWFDKASLAIGEHWKEEVIRAIEQSDFFAILLSKKAAKKTGFIQKEIRTAVREYQLRPQGIAYLLPIRLEECEIPFVRLDDITVLSDLQWMDIPEGDLGAVRRLSVAIWNQWKERLSIQ